MPVEKKRKKIGLALGGGSARGMAHIGVLKELERNNIPIDFIAGTSIGALIGAAYACGMSPEEIEKMALSANYKDLIDFTVPSRGLILGTNIEVLLGKITNYKHFHKTRVPLAVIAADLDTGRKVIFKRGSVMEAVRASISIPGVFPPVKKGKHRYVDGGVLDPLPVGVVRDMGADIVIAVDLSVDMKDRYSVITEDNFMAELKKKFFNSQVSYVKRMVKEKRFRLPNFLNNLINWLVELLVRPERIAKIIMNYISGKGSPGLFSILGKTMFIMENELTKSILKSSNVDVIIKPKFVGISFAEFNLAKKGIDEGQRSTKYKIYKIKRLLNS